MVRHQGEDNMKELIGKAKQPAGTQAAPPPAHSLELIGKAKQLAQLTLNNALAALIHQSQNGLDREEIKKNAEIAWLANDLLSTEIKPPKQPKTAAPSHMTIGHPPSTIFDKKPQAVKKRSNEGGLLEILSDNKTHKSEKICDALEITPNALYKLLQRLRQKGHKIRSGVSGYQLQTASKPKAKTNKPKAKKKYNPGVHFKEALAVRKAEFEAKLAPVMDSLRVRFNNGDEIPNKEIEGKALVYPAIMRLEAEGFIESYRDRERVSGLAGKGGQPPKIWRRRKS